MKDVDVKGMEKIIDLEPNLYEKISQMEELLGITFEIFSESDKYFYQSHGDGLLIQEGKIIAFGASRVPKEHFPMIVQTFPDLTHLTLVGSNFSTIPAEIVNLSNLTNLTLRNNHIQTIPDYICQLHHLTDLDLRDNNITALPECIGSLSQLERLFLACNKINLLPASLSQCSSLIRLGLAYNPLVSLAGIPPSLPNCDVD
ncbi:MAG: leucine-rich repeat domain-containing protein, partial [Promethearchaeota archaeon]